MFYSWLLFSWFSYHLVTLWCKCKKNSKQFREISLVKFKVHGLYSDNDSNDHRVNHTYVLFYCRVAFSQTVLSKFTLLSWLQLSLYYIVVWTLFLRKLLLRYSFDLGTLTNIISRLLVCSALKQYNKVGLRSTGWFLYWHTYKKIVWRLR